MVVVAIEGAAAGASPRHARGAVHRDAQALRRRCRSSGCDARQQALLAARAQARPRLRALPEPVPKAAARSARLPWTARPQARRPRQSSARPAPQAAPEQARLRRQAPRAALLPAPARSRPQVAPASCPTARPPRRARHSAGHADRIVARIVAVGRLTEPTAGAELAGALRIESPTVPDPCTADAASGDPNGALAPSCAHAGDASAIATIAVATIRAARLTLFGFFTVALRHDFSLNLRMKLEHARLGMPAQSDSRSLLIRRPRSSPARAHRPCRHRA